MKQEKISRERALNLTLDEFIDMLSDENYEFILDSSKFSEDVALIDAQEEYELSVNETYDDEILTVNEYFDLARKEYESYREYLKEEEQDYEEEQRRLREEQDY